jgi:hypothetical protein
MRTKLKNVQEVMHFWANQVQDEGEAASVSFRGGRLFSYNTCIAEIVNGAVLVNAGSYSVTTSKHQSYMQRAIPHGVTVIHVPYQSRGTQGLSPEWINFSLHVREPAEREAAQWLVKAKRGRPGNADAYRAKAHDLLKSIEAYAALFGIVYAAPTDVSELEEAANAAHQAQLEAQKKAKAEREADQAERLEKWRNGESNYTYFEITALRLSADGSEVETSRGARIPVEDAKRVWPLLKRVHDQGAEFKAGLSPIKLGHYNMTGFDGKTLQVGCHAIPFTEVQQIAERLGL